MSIFATKILRDMQKKETYFVPNAGYGSHRRQNRRLHRCAAQGELLPTHLPPSHHGEEV